MCLIFYINSTRSASQQIKSYQAGTKEIKEMHMNKMLPPVFIVLKKKIEKNFPTDTNVFCCFQSCIEVARMLGRRYLPKSHLQAQLLSI